VTDVVVVGGGLAGSEAAWQAAERGASVRLHEMRPVSSTPAHKTDRMAELVCSNSLKSDSPDDCHGLLKRELTSYGSVIMLAARAHAIPAGSALAAARATSRYYHRSGGGQGDTGREAGDYRHRSTDLRPAGRRAA